MKKLAITLLIFLFLSSCVETVAVGSVAGVIITTREKSLEDTKKDVFISIKIDKDLLLNNLKTPRNSVKVMVNEGRVLLVGTVRNLDKGKEANKIVWNTDGVKELIDEVEVEQKGLGARDFAGGFIDSYITAKIRSKLFFSRKVTAADFKIKTENNTVYILGVAKNDHELKEALDIIASTVGVKRVVNHSILVNDRRRNG